ncbi:MAG: hypothetical protein H6R00_182 [Proteobacteria bacterium]|nr:hypothetical protein [Pseudomonadota bacterium]
MTTVNIAGVDVDQDDPCALYAALYGVYLKRLAGQEVEELTIQSPLTRETVKYSAISLDAFEDRLSTLKAACERKRGRRSRFAKSIRFA